MVLQSHSLNALALLPPQAASVALKLRAAQSAAVAQEHHQAVQAQLMTTHRAWAETRAREVGAVTAPSIDGHIAIPQHTCPIALDQGWQAVSSTCGSCFPGLSEPYINSLGLLYESQICQYRAEPATMHCIPDASAAAAAT